jgi:hypothetical protein
VDLSLDKLLRFWDAVENGNLKDVYFFDGLNDFAAKCVGFACKTHSAVRTVSGEHHAGMSSWRMTADVFCAPDSLMEQMQLEKFDGRIFIPGPTFNLPGNMGLVGLNPAWRAGAGKVIDLGKEQMLVARDLEITFAKGNWVSEDTWRTTALR